MNSEHRLHNLICWLSFYLPDSITFKSYESLCNLLKTEAQKSKYSDLFKPEDVSPNALKAVFKDLGKECISVSAKNGLVINIEPGFKAFLSSTIEKTSPTLIKKVKELAGVLFRSAEASSSIVVKKITKESDRVLEVYNSLSNKNTEIASMIKRLYDLLEEKGL